MLLAISGYCLMLLAIQVLSDTPLAITILLLPELISILILYQLCKPFEEELSLVLNLLMLLAIQVLSHALGYLGTV